jgi:hypothetical protein
MTDQVVLRAVGDWWCFVQGYLRHYPAIATREEYLQWELYKCLKNAEEPNCKVENQCPTTWIEAHENSNRSCSIDICLRLPTMLNIRRGSYLAALEIKVVTDRPPYPAISNDLKRLAEIRSINLKNQHDGAELSFFLLIGAKNNVELVTKYYLSPLSSTKLVTVNLTQIKEGKTELGDLEYFLWKVEPVATVLTAIGTIQSEALNHVGPASGTSSAGQSAVTPARGKPSSARLSAVTPPVTPSSAGQSAVTPAIGPSSAEQLNNEHAASGSSSAEQSHLLLPFSKLAINSNDSKSATDSKNKNAQTE